MIHASRELVEGVRGVYLAHIDDEADSHSTPGCAAESTRWKDIIWGWDADRLDFGFEARGAYVSEVPRESMLDVSRIDCPKCLVAMRAAICPVRWDSLCERGLVDFLVPKSEAQLTQHLESA